MLALRVTPILPDRFGRGKRGLICDFTRIVLEARWPSPLPPSLRCSYDDWLTLLMVTIAPGSPRQEGERSASGTFSYDALAVLKVCYGVSSSRATYLGERPESAHLAHSRAPRRRSPFRSHSRRSASAAGTRLRAPKLPLLAHLIHREGSGEWRSSRNSRKRRCALRLLHRWELLSEAGAGGFGTGLVGRSRPRGSRCSGHQSGRDVADEVSIWASSSEG
jgi:hypothetical protein